MFHNEASGLSAKITSPELIAQINPKNIRLMNDFLEYLRSVGKAETTVKAYTSDLYIFFVWVLQNADNKYFPEVSKRDIVSYQNWLLRNNENSPARVRRLKSTLSSLSNYIEAILDDELPNFRSIIRKIENPVNEPTREKTVLTDEQADALLERLVERGQYEKACCFALARYSGRRKSELTRFKVSYFDDENIIYGSLYKTPEKVRTKGKGVNGKMLTCYVLSKPFKTMDDVRNDVAALMNGSGTTTETEDDDMTDLQVREICKQVLAEQRKELQDNDCGTWSQAARDWATSTGLIVGSGNGPDGQPNYMWADILTREQAAQLLYRFAQMMGKA